MDNIQKLIDSKLIEIVVDDFAEKYGADEQALNQLFKTYNKNNVYEQVLIKVITLNELYSTQLYSKQLHLMVQRIISLTDLDSLLRTGDIEAIHLIGQKTNDDFNSAFVFASKYCSFHNPKSFPIFDSLSRNSIFKLNEKYCFTSIKYKNRLEDYSFYKNG